MQTIYKECWICLGLWVIFKKQKRTLKYVLNMKLKKKEEKTRRDMHYIGIKNDRHSSAQKNVEYVKHSWVIPNFFQVP